MRLDGECIFSGVREGVKKDGKPWFSSRYLDNDADAFFTIFIDEALYRELLKVPKRTPVLLTLNLVPGQKYVTLENVEVISR